MTYVQLLLCRSGSDRNGTTRHARSRRSKRSVAAHQGDGTLSDEDTRESSAYRRRREKADPATQATGSISDDSYDSRPWWQSETRIADMFHAAIGDAG